MAIEVNRRYLAWRRELVHESEIRIREMADVRQHSCEISRARDAVPFRKRRRIFVDRGRRDPASFADIIRPIDCDGGISSIDVSAFDRIAQNQRMTSPRVIGSAAI